MGVHNQRLDCCSTEPPSDRRPLQQPSVKAAAPGTDEEQNHHVGGEEGERERAASAADSCRASPGLRGSAPAVVVLRDATRGRALLEYVL